MTAAERAMVAKLARIVAETRAAVVQANRGYDITGDKMWQDRDAALTNIIRIMENP